MTKFSDARKAFFWEHACYSYDPKTETKAQGRRRCAEALAQAETWAEEHGLTFHWDWDDSPDLSWMSEESRADVREVLAVVAKYRDGRVAASLCGITDPDANYRRVIEAELASEAHAGVLVSLMGAI